MVKFFLLWAFPGHYLNFPFNVIWHIETKKLTMFKWWWLETGEKTQEYNQSKTYSSEKVQLKKIESNSEPKKQSLSQDSNLACSDRMTSLSRLLQYNCLTARFN